MYQNLRYYKKNIDYQESKLTGNSNQQVEKNCQIAVFKIKKFKQRNIQFESILIRLKIKLRILYIDC